VSIDVVADVELEQLAIAGRSPSDVFGMMLDDEMTITRRIRRLLFTRWLKV